MVGSASAFIPSRRNPGRLVALSRAKVLNARDRRRVLVAAERPRLCVLLGLYWMCVLLPERGFQGRMEGIESRKTCPESGSKHCIMSECIKSFSYDRNATCNIAHTSLHLLSVAEPTLSCGATHTSFLTSLVILLSTRKDLRLPSNAQSTCKALLMRPRVSSKLSSTNKCFLPVRRCFVMVE